MTTRRQVKRGVEIIDRITPELRKKYREAQQRPGAKKLPRPKRSGAKKLPKPKRGYSEQQQKAMRTRKKKGGSIGTHNRLY